MYFLSDIIMFSRTKGSKDKSIRKRKISAIKAGLVGALVGAGSMLALQAGIKIARPKSKVKLFDRNSIEAIGAWGLGGGIAGAYYNILKNSIKSAKSNKKKTMEINTSELDNLINFFKQASEKTANLKVTGQTDINLNLNQILPHTKVEIPNGVVPIVTKLPQLKVREVQSVQAVRQTKSPKQIKQPDAEVKTGSFNNIKLLDVHIAEAVIKSIFKSSH